MKRKINENGIMFKYIFFFIRIEKKNYTVKKKFISSFFTKHP